MRRAAKVDRNHPEIRQAARDLGMGWLDCHQLKKACDAFVTWKGRTAAIEIKDPEKPPSARKLTEGEEAFCEMWTAAGGNYAVIETISGLVDFMEEI